MATLMFAKDLVKDLAKIEKTVLAKVAELPEKFANPTKGLNLEKIVSSADPHVRTVRVDKYWRGIVYYPGSGDTYVLTRILGEEDANIYAGKVKFGVNPVSGAFEVTDLAGIEAKAPAPDAAPAVAKSLFADTTDEDLLTVGIHHDAIPVLRRITDRKELDGITGMFPLGQADALQLLADGVEIGDVVALISEAAPDTGTDEPAADELSPDGPVDTSDVAAALERPASKAEFTIIGDDAADLADWLTADFELWTVFLHPTQEKFAYKPTFNGPAKLTGAAGTGKTVTALHRAQYLAQQAIREGEPTDRILLTTYTKALKTELGRRIELLCTPEEARRIDVVNIDGYAARICAEADSVRTRPIFDTGGQIRERWHDVIGHLELDLDADFLDDEWEQVVLGSSTPIGSMRDYLTAPRKGRGSRLSRGQRVEVWKAVEAFTERLATDGYRTVLQTADVAARILDSRTVRPFRHVIVDEAQDLHPAQWRLVRAAVRAADAPMTNDLFIVGDAHQRIYGHHVTLSRLGIDTRGRARRLRLNYRTTQQIHRWAMAIRQGIPVDDLDGHAETALGSHAASAFSGVDPTVTGHTTAGDEARAVAGRIEELLEQDIPAAQIAVIARTNASLDRIENALNGIPTQRLTDDTQADPGRVVLSTMHKVKGGEYRSVILTHISKGQVPLDSIDGVITPPRVDPVRHAQDVERERNLLYVAASRARDTLDIHYHGTPSPFLGPEGGEP